jgi:MarR family 2-MHQ and catechol resistance regulon transcriptional repressor
MGTKYHGDEDEVSALNAYINLVRAAEAIVKRAHAYVAAEGFIPSEFGVLEVLHYCGTLRQGELAKKLLKTCGTLTSNVDALEERGLVLRQRSQDDRRVVRVSLTKSGKALIERMFPHHARSVAEQFSMLSRMEREQLRRLCRKLGKGPQADRDDDSATTVSNPRTVKFQITKREATPQARRRSAVR